MVAYIEQFETPQGTYGIEDHKDGRPVSEHFFHDRKGRKRFHCWENGRGIGEFDTLEEARRRVHGYAIARLRNEVTAARARIAVLQKKLDKIKDDVFHLGRIAVDPEKRNKEMKRA